MRRRARYEGRVQGVGFRATARRLAGDFAVTGWVRNEPDGSVVLEVQGGAGEIEAYLARLGEVMTRSIHARQLHDLDEQNDESGFEARA